MSTSSRIYGESDSSRIELPVFVTPVELVFATNKKRSLLTVFNPYGNEAQFRIMTTSPDRFDVSITKGTIKPNRRMDITIRLLSQKIAELPEPSDEALTIDYFRVTLQVGQLKGNKPIKVFWCLNADLMETDESQVQISPATTDEQQRSASKLRLRSSKNASSNSPLSAASHSQRSSQRPQTSRLGWQTNQASNGSNVNLDSELCKRSKTQSDQTSAQQVGIFSQLNSLLSVSYEMKLGCSFALGLFTYRLISTLPD